MGLFGFGRKVSPETRAAVLDYLEWAAAIVGEHGEAEDRWDALLAAATSAEPEEARDANALVATGEIL